MSNSSFELVTSALGLGLASGLSPGPLTALAITETVRHGAREGAKTSIAPAFADLPAIGVALYASSWFATYPAIAQGLSVMGGAFLFWLAWGNWRARPPVRAANAGSTRERPRAFAQAFWLSLLGPYALVFWTGVGGGYLHRAWSSGWASVLVFIAAFYLAVAVCKLLWVAAAAWARPVLERETAFLWCGRVAATLLVVFGCAVLWRGFSAAPTDMTSASTEARAPASGVDHHPSQ